MNRLTKKRILMIEESLSGLNSQKSFEYSSKKINSPLHRKLSIYTHVCVAAAAQAQSLFESFAQSVSVQRQCVMTKSITDSMSRVQSQPRARVLLDTRG